MTLTTWNLLADCHLRPGWYPHVAPADLDPVVRWPRVLAALTASNADILCLQEVPPAQLDAIRAALAPRQIVHAPHLGEGVAIASRVPFFGVETVEVGRKRAIVARLATGQRVASVHLTWTGPEGDQRPGVTQLAAVLRLAPDILAGDFNAFPDWPERRLANDAGYLDIGPGAPTCNVNAWLQPLDTVLVRPPLSGRGAPLPAITAHTPMPSALFPSDHLPVTVRIE
jgi:endonuclease/exonuclease/phosphatase family metal-dependent hydrolase